MSPDQQAVVFDWNGTIPDDVELFRSATNEVLALFGKAPVGLASYQEAYNVPVNNMYIAFGCTEKEMREKSREMVDVWRDYYESRALQVPLRQGAVEVLSGLCQKGYKVAVLSNYIADTISRQAHHLGVHHYFSEILACSHEELATVMSRKGKGDRLRDFIKAHKVQQAIIVGDSPEEIEIARHYGYVGIGLLRGCCSESRLRDVSPDFLINHLDELPPIVEKVFGRGGHI